MYKKGTIFRNTVSNMVGRITELKETDFGKMDYYEVEFFSLNIISTGYGYNDFEIRKTQIFTNEFDMLLLKNIIHIIDLELNIGDKFINTMNGTVATLVDYVYYDKIDTTDYKFKVSETNFDSLGYQPGQVDTSYIQYSKWQIEDRLMRGYIKEVDGKDDLKWKFINDLRG